MLFHFPSCSTALPFSFLHSFTWQPTLLLILLIENFLFTYFLPASFSPSLLCRSRFLHTLIRFSDRSLCYLESRVHIPRWTLWRRRRRWAMKSGVINKRRVEEEPVPGEMKKWKEGVCTRRGAEKGAIIKNMSKGGFKTREGGTGEIRVCVGGGEEGKGVIIIGGE